MSKHKHIGTVVAELREGRNMSQAEVAAALEVEEGTVAAWERGEAEPDSDTLLHIALLFGVSRDVLLEVENPSENTQQKQIEKDQDLFKIICRAIALAMGIAVTVLSILNKINIDSAIAMLGLGLTCLGIASFSKRK